VIIRLDDDIWGALPSWMLDETFCANLCDVSMPILPLTTLRTLVGVLDQQGGPGASLEHAHQPTSKDLTDTQRYRHSAGTAPTAADTIAGSDISTVPLAAGGGAQDNHPQRKEGATS
jgi:hypothetical protein